MPKSPNGGTDRVSTKSRLSGELEVLGKVLVDVRERSGLKQGQVADRLGLPASYLSKVEKGTRRLDVIELVQLAAAMDVRAAEIVGLLEEKLAQERAASNPDSSNTSSQKT